jgi:O-antigen ligase
MEKERADKRSHSRSPALYWRLDIATEYLLYAILIFTPWAFGTTEDWSIQTVNWLNYCLGGLLVAKWITRLTTGFHPARWDGAGALRGVNPMIVLGPLAGFTIVMLAYTGIAAWNARAEFIPQEQRFDYFEYIKWLPTSYDRSATWMVFQRYLALACFFWALRDWVVTKSRREARPDTDLVGEAAIGPELEETKGGYYSYDPTRFPMRLKRLLWVVCTNGAALAVQGTLQRLSGSDKLLWVLQPETYNRFAYSQFGPFTYRSNGAQYVNMIWPVALAFWWALNQQGRKKIGEGAEFVLMVFAALMAAAPIISSSRGGVVIEVAQMFGVLVIFGYSFRRAGWWKTVLVATIFVVIIGSAAALNWEALQFRLEENNLNSLSGRTVIYENSKRIVEDFPVYGTGAGTFGAVYQLYRTDPEQSWYAYAHDDYLQTVVTYGRVGFTIIMFMLVSILAYWFLARGIPTSELFIAFVWLAAAGCLLHARFDFPLQIYSLQIMFVTLCGILTVLARRN